jgi:hypothetical protein
MGSGIGVNRLALSARETDSDVLRLAGLILWCDRHVEHRSTPFNGLSSDG